MGIAERREREKEALRTRIVEAARDIISESGLDALSMRSIAERIEYSPGTIYLYFKDKDALLNEVILAGFETLREFIDAEMAKVTPEANPALQHRALGRAYVKFALENTAYFRVMFELPTVPQLECAKAKIDQDIPRDNMLVDAVQRAIDAEMYRIKDAETGALVAWGLLHGLTSLHLSGHLADSVKSNEALLDLVEAAMDMLGSGLTGGDETASAEVA